MKRFIFASVITLAIVVVGRASGVFPVAIHQAISVAAPMVTLNLSDEQLATVDLADATSGLTAIEKVQWSNIYTHRGVNRQASLINLFQAGSVGHMGYDIDIPAPTIAAMKAEVNALASRMASAQTFVANLTD